MTRIKLAMDPPLAMGKGNQGVDCWAKGPERIHRQTSSRQVNWPIRTLIMNALKRRARVGAIAAGLVLGPQSRPGLAQEGAEALAALRPVVRHFDFEEPDAAPNSLPADFVRNIAPSQGFPNFGSMRLTTSAAYRGRGSFEFELAGGSMSASVPASVIPILPFSDYQVSAYVRTDGLAHSRARLAAWLHDKTGKPIHSSRVHSELAQTAGAWQLLSVEVRGDFPDAADLVLDLQLLQPAQFIESETAIDEPRPQDFAGRVWFDDVMVSQHPRVRLSLAQPTNIVQWPSAPEFVVTVNELNRRELTARLRIVDLDGRGVFDVSFPAARGRQQSRVQAPIAEW